MDLKQLVYERRFFYCKVHRAELKAHVGCGMHALERALIHQRLVHFESNSNEKPSRHFECNAVQQSNNDYIFL